MSRFPKALLEFWSSRDLAQQFLIMASIVVLSAMGVNGWWVAQRIEQSVTENTAHASALYMESSVAPLIQELAVGTLLSEKARKQLDALFADPAIRERVISMKIWRPDGTIVYSTFPEMIGQSFEPSHNFRKALSGKIAAEFDNDPHLEDHNERRLSRHLLEIYAPLRNFETRKVIAISEFYANGDKLEGDILAARRLSWLVAAAVTLSMLAALYTIVRRGSRTIDLQQRKLTEQVEELRRLLEQNEELRNRLQHASANVAQVSERILQRVGADLHDGPAQLLTYALMRFKNCTALVERTGDVSSVRELQAMRVALQDTLREVRNLSEGLSLPELEGVTLETSIRQAADWHRQHTNSVVDLEIGPLPPLRRHALNVCLYRFVQEGLANAFHHAEAVGQRVEAHYNAELVVSVQDRGPGLQGRNNQRGGLGIQGLRARVEAAGGEFEVLTEAGQGTRLVARFKLQGV